MATNKNETSITLKRTKPRYIVINEDIHEALDMYTLSLYMAFRYEADYSKEDSIIKRSAQFLADKAKISRRQFYVSLNILEDFGLVLRDSENKVNQVSSYHVAQELHYFNTDCGVVHDMHRGVHHMHTDHYSFPLNNTTNSESDASPATAEKIKKSDNAELRELIDIYRQEFPNNPQPHEKLISTSLEKVLRTFIKRWPEADPNNNALTHEAFRRYMVGLKEYCPKFALGEYETQSGRKKKNGLETFCRWNTFVKFLENQYS